MHEGTIKNGVSIIAGDALSKGVGLVLLFCLADYLSPGDFGLLSFVLAYVAFFGVFTDLGINTLVTRNVSAGLKDPSVAFGNAIAVRLAASVVTVFALLASLYLMGYATETVRLAAAASLALFISSKGLFFRRVFDIPFQAGLKMHVPAAINLFSELATLGAALWLMGRGAGLTALLLGMVMANAPAFVLYAWLSTRSLRPRVRLATKEIREMLKDSLPLGAATLFEGLFLIMPLFALSLLTSKGGLASEALGYYSLPFRLVVSLWIVPVAVMLSVLPAMSRAGSGSSEEAAATALKGLKLILVIALPAALGLSFFAGPVIALVGGPEYAPAGPVLAVMAWGTAAYFVNTVFFYTFVAIGRQKANTWVWAGVSVFSLVLCLTLVPAWGHSGAAWAYTAPLVAGVALNLLRAPGTLGLKSMGVLVRYSACAVSAGAVLMVGPFGRVPNIALASTVWLAAMATLGVGLPIRRVRSARSPSE